MFKHVKELMESVGLKENELINTNHGAMEVQAVKDGMVHLAWLADGKQQKESIESFQDKMKEYKK